MATMITGRNGFDFIDQLECKEKVADIIDE